MSIKFIKAVILFFLFTTPNLLIAQTESYLDLDTTKSHGDVWGYAFGDYAFKTSGDTVTQKNGTTATSGRGGSNQYTGVPANQSMFQFRRIYLGYNYYINKKFSAEFLLAAEDDYAGGDMLANKKFSPYIKLANIRWKGIYPGADFLIGNIYTPTFSLLSELVWGYRSVERTIADIRRTPSFDQGAAIQGRFDHVHDNPQASNSGYNLMVGNGSGAEPGTNGYKWLYADIWAKFLDKRLIIDIYQDYNRLNWTPVVTGSINGYHSDRAMTKLFVAYTVPKFTIGIEAFQNTIIGGVQLTGTDGNIYYRTVKATDISLYARGRIYKNKFGFFARYDNYNPSHDISEINNTALYKSYVLAPGNTNYDPGTKEQFVTLGIDYTPVSNVHFMPNLWVNTYQTTLTPNEYFLNPNDGTGVKGTDVVYRLTFYYLFGKKEPIRF